MVEDIGLILRGLIKDSEYSLATNGSTTAHCLVRHDGTGIVAATASAIDVIGAESRGLAHGSAEPITFKSCGITPVATYGKLEVGKPIKAGPGGKAVRFLDANLVGGALGDFTTKTGGDFANQPAGDTVDVVSDDAGDVGQTVTVYGLVGAALETETYTLNGLTEDTGAKAFVRIHAVVISAAHAGNVIAHEHSGGLAIVTIATGTLSVGRIAVADGRAHCAKPDFVASAASTKYIAVYGYSETGAAQSEEIQLNGAAEIPTVGKYATVTYVHIGDLEAARTASGLIADEQDDSNAMAGIALTGVASADDIYVALK